MISQEILKEVRRLTLETLCGRKAKIYLFGSWARGAPSRASDIDIAVEADPPFPPGALAVLRERLEESRIPYRVDVVDLGTSDPAFRESVIRQGILWND